MKSISLVVPFLLAIGSISQLACSESAGDAPAGGGSGGAAAGQAGSGGAAAGSGGAASGSGGAAAGAGGAAAGAGGAAAGAGGDPGGAGAGGGGSGPGGTKVRLANMVTGYKAEAIDMCLRVHSDSTDWSTETPLFKSSGKDASQFFSPTVSIWLDVLQTGGVDYRIVKANSDCSTPLGSDGQMELKPGVRQTLLLLGSVVAPKSEPALLVAESPTSDPDNAVVAPYNGISNAGDKGVEFVEIVGPAVQGLLGDALMPYSGGVGISIAADAPAFGVRRADNGLVLAFTGSTVDDGKDAFNPQGNQLAKGGVYSLFTTGTNENAEKASNNLPWIIFCDDNSTATLGGSDLVAACVYSQGRQAGYVAIK